MLIRSDLHGLSHNNNYKHAKHIDFVETQWLQDANCDEQVCDFR